MKSDTTLSSGQETEATKPNGLTGAITALKSANAKLASGGLDPPMQNTPELTVGEVMKDLKEKHGGNMDLACQELLLGYGIPDKMHLRKSRKASSSK